MLASAPRRSNGSPVEGGLIDGLRAVTYLLHHLAPIFLLCDVRDLGSWLGDTTPAETGVVATRESTRRRLLEAEQFTPTIYLYDAHAGGIGLAERVFDVLPQLLRRGLETSRRAAALVLSVLRGAGERSRSPREGDGSALLRVLAD